MGAGGMELGSFNLVTQFPRRVLRRCHASAAAAEEGSSVAVDGSLSDPSLHEVGLGTGQEVFFLEAYGGEGKSSS